MFGDMMGKLQQMQQQMEETKARLDGITVQGEAQGIIVIANGNRKIQDIQIPADIDVDTESLQDLLLTATNRALDAAENVWDSEMKGAASGFMPNLPGS